MFRTVKSSSILDNKAIAAGVKRTRGVAFGTGAADEDDSYGMMEDYVSTEADPRKGMLFEIAGDSDEEDLPYVMGRYILPHACKLVACICLSAQEWCAAYRHSSSTSQLQAQL